MDKNGEELSFKKYRASLVAHHKRVRTLFDEVLANKAKRIKIKVISSQEEGELDCKIGSFFMKGSRPFAGLHEQKRVCRLQSW